MPWTYKMGRMQPADAKGIDCDEPKCPRNGSRHDADYRVEATNAGGEVRRRNLCIAAAPAMAARVGHAFPPGLWK